MPAVWLTGWHGHRAGGPPPRGVPAPVRPGRSSPMDPSVRDRWSRMRTDHRARGRWRSALLPASAKPADGPTARQGPAVDRPWPRRPGRRTPATIWSTHPRPQPGVGRADRAHALRTLGAAWACAPTEPTGTGTASDHARRRAVRVDHERVDGGSARLGRRRSASRRPTGRARSRRRRAQRLRRRRTTFDGLRFVAGGPSRRRRRRRPRRTGDHVRFHRGASWLATSPMRAPRSTRAPRSRWRTPTSGPYENLVDFVAVQHGHVLRSVIHHGDDWCLYAKGGSADLAIAGNRFHHCGTGGFVGQGTGFEFAVAPLAALRGLRRRDRGQRGARRRRRRPRGERRVRRPCSPTTPCTGGPAPHVIEVVHGGGLRRGHRHLHGPPRRRRLGPAAGDAGQVIPNRHVYVLNNVVPELVHDAEPLAAVRPAGPVDAPAGNERARS